jgi:hypothetical protein
MSIRVLAVVVTLLVIVCGRQYSEIRNLRLRLDALQVRALADDRRAAADSMAGQGSEIAGVLAWLHGYYKAAEGLQRPDGLWIDDHPDYEGIAHWVFDVYLRNRLGGLTPMQAQQAVDEAIKGTDEWRTKHQTKK